MDVRVSPDSYNPYPAHSFIFFGSCVNEGRSGTGPFMVRFEVDGRAYCPDIPVGDLDSGAYTEVSWQPEPDSIPPGEHVLAFICNPDHVIEPPDPARTKLVNYFRVSDS
jgi:hypothetical protein